MRIVSFFFLSFSFSAAFSLFRKRKSGNNTDQAVCMVPVTTSTASPGFVV